MYTLTIRPRAKVPVKLHGDTLQDIYEQLVVNHKTTPVKKTVKSAVTPAYIVAAAAALFNVPHSRVQLTGVRSPAVGELIEISKTLSQLDHLVQRRNNLIKTIIKNGDLTRTEVRDITGLSYPRVLQLLK